MPNVEDDMSIEQRIQNGNYANPIAYSKETSKAYSDANTEINNRFRKDLEKYYGTDAFGEKARNAIFEKAWNAGHASGFADVDYHYSEFVELAMIVIRDCNERRDAA